MSPDAMISSKYGRKGGSTFKAKYHKAIDCHRTKVWVVPAVSRLPPSSCSPVSQLQDRKLQINANHGAYQEFFLDLLRKYIKSM